MKTTASLLIGLSLLLSSCMSRQAVIQKHYTIEWPDLQERIGTVQHPPLEGSCEVETVKVSPVYARNQIVNRSGSHEVTFYKYHMWAVRPSLAITELVTRYMEEKKLFVTISSRYSRDIPDYILVSEVQQLEVIEKNNLFGAHILIDFKLVGNESDTTLIHHQADRTEPLEDKDLNLFAKAVSEILFEELETMSARITDELAPKQQGRP